MKPGPSPSPERSVLSNAPAAVLVAVLAASLVTLDAAALLAILPVLGREVGAGFTDLQWIAAAGLLAPAALCPLAAALAETRGARRLLVAGCVAFALGTLLSWRALTVLDLLASRAITGVGGALLAGAAASVLPSGRTASWALPAAVGAVLGGWLATAGSWRGTFAVLGGASVLLGVAGLLVLPSRKSPDRRRESVDSAGGVAGLAALAGLTYALVQGPTDGWTDPKVAASLVLGGVAFLGFADLQRNLARPLVPAGLLASPSFLVGGGALTLVHGATAGTLLFLLLELQVVVGWDPLRAAVAAAGVLLTAGVTGAITARLSDHRGTARLPAGVGLGVAAAGAVLLSRFGPSPHAGIDLLPGLAALGLGLGLATPPLRLRVLRAPSWPTGAGSAPLDALIRVGWLLGIAALPVTTEAASLRMPGGSALHRAFGTGMVTAAGVLAVAALLALWAPGAGSESRRPPGRHGGRGLSAP